MEKSLIETVKNAMEEISPLSNALEKWDNVGILLKSRPDNNKKVLLTIDFTFPVLQECISKNIKTVVCYHPIIFSKIKTIDYESDIIHSIIKNEISVFCPHTSLDKLMNLYYFETVFKTFNFNEVNFDGLFCFAENETSIGNLVGEVKNAFKLKVVRVAYGIGHNQKTVTKKVCVGVGAGFGIVNFSDAIIFTGEMRHHEILNAVNKRCTVVLLEHCCSERIFLNELKVKLGEKLESVEILVSENDKSPIEYEF